MQRNNIQVLTIGYIESDEFWPRIFRQQRLNKINKADNDNLLAAKIIFTPVATDGPPTGYTTTLELTGKTSTVYELLSISQAEVDSIAASTSQQQLGNTTFATPNEAKETVVSALIAALERVDAGIVNNGEFGQEKELITEILQFLIEIYDGYNSGNGSPVPECIFNGNGTTDLVIELVYYYLTHLDEILEKLNSEDVSELSRYVVAYNESANPASYRSTLTEEDWFLVSCKIYAYLNDEIQGLGSAQNANTGMAKIENLIEEYRLAKQQGLTSFIFHNEDYSEVSSVLYNVQGVSPLQLGLIDKRKTTEDEIGISLLYDLQDAPTQREVFGTNFENSTIFQFYKPNWNFSDEPELQLYTYNTQVETGLSSKVLLKDYLPGKYDYQLVQIFINRIINSNDKGDETLDLNGFLSGVQVYARNVDFGEKGTYDLYLSRTGNLDQDESSFYNYTKNELTSIFGFSGSFTQYRIFSTSGGTTSITLPTLQSPNFENLVLKLSNKDTGTPYIDLMKAIRTANLNSVSNLEITQYGSQGGISPVFEIDHNGEKLKLMIGFPLLSNRKNEINPAKQPYFIAGGGDNRLGKSGTYQVFEFENSKGNSSAHNMKIYFLVDQEQLLESYLLIEREILIEGISWRNQSDSYFKERSCYNTSMGNACCMQASLTIVQQFGVTTDVSRRTNIAEFVSPETDYVSLRPTANFEAQVEYLNLAIKPNKQGGKPVLVGVHYNKNKKPYNGSNPATYHFIVIVGKGYDKSARKHYFRFYDVGEPDDEKATSSNNKLFIEKNQRMLRGEFDGKTYTVTEVRENL
ncbi:MAG: hypothetical protein RIG68_26590 [Imperialibacter sp.]|uniref:hypothetical protein n=1 Tax=Imperialibacter sp. TaxID=2038411 RepID=UPI0032ED4AE3